MKQLCILITILMLFAIDTYSQSLAFQNPDGPASVELIGGVNSIDQDIRPITSMIWKIPFSTNFTFSIHMQYVWDYTMNLNSERYFNETVRITTGGGFNTAFGFKFYLVD